MRSWPSLEDGGLRPSFSFLLLSLHAFFLGLVVFFVISLWLNVGFNTMRAKDPASVTQMDHCRYPID